MEKGLGKITKTKYSGQSKTIICFNCKEVKLAGGALSPEFDIKK